MSKEMKRGRGGKRRGSQRKAPPVKRTLTLSGGPKLKFVGVGQQYQRDYIVKVPRTCQFFPDLYVAWATTDTNTSFTTLNSSTSSFVINSPAFDFGPQFNYAGGFGNNAPSGMKYLLSGLANAGAGSPYSGYIVTHYECEARIGSSSISANSVPWIAGITFSTNAVATSGMTVTQLPEQPRTMRIDVPYVTATKPLLVANSVALGDLVGLKFEEFAIQRPNYGTIVGVYPVIPMYAHFWMRPYDGSTTGSYEIFFRHRFRIEFYGLNTFSTTVPTLREDRVKEESKTTARGWLG